LLATRARALASRLRELADTTHASTTSRLMQLFMSAPELRTWSISPRIGVSGILLWPAVAEHTVVAVLLLIAWRNGTADRPSGTTASG
jgi:hypothetical protein